MHVRHAAAALAFLGAAAAVPHAVRAEDVLPAALAAYRTSDLATRAPIATPEARRFSFDPAMIESSTPAEKPGYLPLLYSLLVPGAGEISMGYYKRGIALVALEVIAWTGYAVNHSDGMDKRDAYESFADQYWTVDKWVADHPCNVEQFGERNLENLELCGQASSGSGVWPGYVPYVSKEDDKQHYYENLGKYDWYISGWEDWNPASNPYEMDTDLRTQYREMRGESNDALDTANEFIWVSVAARAFSLVETAIIIHNRRADFDAAAGGGGMALRARARGFDGAELALEVPLP